MLINCVLVMNTVVLGRFCWGGVGGEVGWG